MEKVSKEKAKQITAELELEIKKVLAKHGMEMNDASTKFGDLYSFKFEASTLNLGANGVNLNTREAQEMMRFGFNYGLKNPEKVLGTKVKLGGRQMIIAGLNIRKKNAPVVCKDDAGNFYAVSELVLAGLEK